MNHQCLVLNPWWVPHQVISWQVSICDEFLGKLDVLERYEETVSSPSVTIRIPAVGRLTGKMRREKKDVKFSRVNVYQRDEYRCQYCGHRPTPKELNYDHVLPRARGGRTEWTNIATSCVECNRRKGNRTPAQAGMPLRSVPRRPKSLPMTSLVALPREVPALWLPYLRDRLVELSTA
jgi:5-methylcytosine-specific restriction endonuclease McrA